MFLSFIYDFFLLLISLIALPKLIYMRLIHKKYKSSFCKRLGKNFPDIEKKSQSLIWVHAVSVGETKVAAVMVKQLKKEYPNSMIVVSSVTETGHVEAMRAIPQADYHVYLPFDFAWIIKSIVNKTKPDLVVICESDFWYNFLNASKAQGAKIVLINGKISENSMNNFSKIPFFSQNLFSKIDFYCLQNKHYQDRFAALGISSEKMAITGNIKFDDTCIPLSDEQLHDFRSSLGIKKGDQVLVFGSTHDPEEKFFIKCLQELWEIFPHLKAILVPRHPERFKEVKFLLEKHRIPFHKFSKVDKEIKANVILMDAMGLLRKCYQLADIAIVGGSYTSKIGGHNIMEPSWFGIPALFGPFMHQQPELVELVKEYGAGVQIKVEEIVPTVENLLKDSEKRAHIGRRGLQMIHELNGANTKTLKVISSLLDVGKHTSSL
jgi:3-deoxy-D-manno-octulosonic-acid transferase